jgi:hypothetical protein
MLLVRSEESPSYWDADCLGDLTPQQSGSYHSANRTRLGSITNVTCVTRHLASRNSFVMAYERNRSPALLF